MMQNCRKQGNFFAGVVENGADQVDLGEVDFMTQKKEKKEKKIDSFSLFRARVFSARTGKREKKTIFSLFSLFFVSGSRQLHPDQPGLQRARKKRKNTIFSLFCC
jgi:hypothetical protein